MNKYEVHARLEMTAQAKNAGAVGRKFWWVLAGKVQAKSAHAACAQIRKAGNFAFANKLKAVLL